MSTIAYGHLKEWTSVDSGGLNQPGRACAQTRMESGFAGYRAEGEGFEPSSDLTARNGFRDRRIRPLCHPSERRHTDGEAEKEGFEPSKEVITPLTP